MTTRICACLGVLALAAAAEEDLALRRRMHVARSRVFPALVHIINVEESFVRGRAQRSVSSGSGFFIDAEGHVVTNYHVAGQARQLYVTLASRQKVSAQLVAGDPYTDLAVLKVDPKLAFPDGKALVASLGDSDRLEEGDFVMAMGSPLSLSRSVSFGIISCRVRTLDTVRLAGHETGKYNTWLQTDAAINPGNSGGPLVNLDGEVVGVNTRANLAANNIGFAIPSNVVEEVVAALLKHGRVPRSYLGLRLQPLSELEDTLLATVEEGVLVAAVDPESPAAGSGIRPGDFITHLNGETFSARFLEELPGLYHRIAKLPTTGPARLEVRRGDRTVSIDARPVPLGRGIGREAQVEAWGITVRALTKRMRRELGLPDAAGVMVTGIRAGSAAGGRLETGDVIREVQGRPVADLETFLRLTEASVRNGDALVRLVLRRRGVVDVTVLEPESDGGR